MDFLLLILVSFLTIALGVLLWMKKRYSMWRDMGAPYEEPALFFGNLKGAEKNVHFGELTSKFYKKHKGEGPFVGIFFFVSPIALAIDLEFVKNVLIKDFNYFHDRGVYINEKDEPITAHLFTLSGLKWKQIRNKISPTFTSGKMKMMFPIMTEMGKRLEMLLENLSHAGNDIDIKSVMARFTVDAIGSCAFGLDCNSMEDENSEFLQAGLSMFSNPRHGAVFSLLTLAFRNYMRRFGVKILRDEVTEFYTNILRKTVDYRMTNNVQRNDFINLLISLHKSDGEDHLTFNELSAQAFVFLVAGFETSSTTLQFCFYELARNSDIQQKTRDHINEVLKKHNGELTYEAMIEMKYLDQVVNETLRLHLPAPNLIREVTHDYKVPGTKFTLKKGTSVMIPSYAIQYDPEFYPNPVKFNPENFSEQNVDTRPALAFLPFGEGPRMCIGARFAMMQVKIGIISTLRKCKIHVSSKTKQPLKLQTKFFLTHAEGGVWVKLSPLE